MFSWEILLKEENLLQVHHYEPTLTCRISIECDSSSCCAILYSAGPAIGRIWSSDCRILLFQPSAPTTFGRWRHPCSTERYDMSSVGVIGKSWSWMCKERARMDHVRCLPNSWHCWYEGMSFRMCLDLGLHLDSQRLVELGYLSEEEYNIRVITFWGCFIFDRYRSLTDWFWHTGAGQRIWVVHSLYLVKLSTHIEHPLMSRRRPSRGNPTTIQMIENWPTNRS